MKKTYSIVGTKFADAETFVASLKPGVALTLVREPENKFDKNAVAVWCGARKIGYLSSKLNAAIAAKIDASGTKWAVPVKLDAAGPGAVAADEKISVYMAMDGVFKLSPNSAFPQVEVDE